MASSSPKQCDDAASHGSCSDLSLEPSSLFPAEQTSSGPSSVYHQPTNESLLKFRSTEKSSFRSAIRVLEPHPEQQVDRETFRRRAAALPGSFELLVGRRRSPRRPSSEYHQCSQPSRRQVLEGKRRASGDPVLLLYDRRLKLALQRRSSPASGRLDPRPGEIATGRFVPYEQRHQGLKSGSPSAKQSR